MGHVQDRKMERQRYLERVGWGEGVGLAFWHSPERKKFQGVVHAAIGRSFKVRFG